MTIGIIDDDHTYQFITRKMIGKISPDCKLFVFSDGQEAIEYIIHHKYQLHCLPELILLDINMPRLNGWEFLENLKQQQIDDYNPPIYIASSSYDMKDSAKSEIYPEVNGYLLKPLSAETFKEIISSRIKKMD